MLPVFVVFHEILYKRYAIERHPNSVIFSSLQTAIPTWRIRIVSRASDTNTALNLAH